MDENKTQIHQWTDAAGEVLIVRFVTLAGKSYGGFQNPQTVGAVLTVPDEWNSEWGSVPDSWRAGWMPDQKCGGGLHGWPWGMGAGDGKDPDWNACWQVYGVKPEDVVGNVGDGPKCKFRSGILRYVGDGPKCKFRSGILRYVGDGPKCKLRSGILRYSGDWHGAAMFVLSGQMAWTVHNSSGSASNSGDSGSASNSGDSGSASNSGDSGSASTTATGTAAIVTGIEGRAKAAEFGCIALAWWNPKAKRVEMRCAQIGPAKRRKSSDLKPDTWYQLDAKGRFVEVK